VLQLHALPNAENSFASSLCSFSRGFALNVPCINSKRLQSIVFIELSGGTVLLKGITAKNQVYISIRLQLKRNCASLIVCTQTP
jgi:hypothetical protein